MLFETSLQHDTFTLRHLHFLEEGIGVGGVEDFVRPHESYHIRIALVDDIVRIAGRNADDLDLLAGNVILDNL